MTGTEDLRSFFKRDVKEVVPEEQSMMPAFGPERLTDDELADLVRYLRSLRGTK
jgi:mono/diheme cytochrome c family protein